MNPRGATIGVVDGSDGGVDDEEYLRKAWKVFCVSDFPVPEGRKAPRQSISAPTSYNLIISPLSLAFFTQHIPASSFKPGEFKFKCSSSLPRSGLG